MALPAVSSYSCQVLATGLSALYSSLPRKIEVRADDWHCLRREDWMGVPALLLFMNSLEFCNAVLQVAHPLVQKQLVNYVHNGFLVPVLGPALHKTAVEELMASTAYLELFLRSVSDPALLQTFLRFILLHRHDHSPILDTLVARIAANSRLCMVSLSLFRTLLNLNCEDVMLQLVLRYLIPCSHVMLSQKRAVKDLDIYGKTADKFLSLIPRCCRAESLPAPDWEEEHATWAKAHGSPTVDTSTVVTVPKPSTPSRLAFFMRQQSCSSEAGSPAPRSPGLATPGGSPCHRPARWEEVAELDGNYLEYLRDAQLGVEQCVRACRVWSAPYDGEQPSAASLAPSQPAGPPGPATPRTKKRGLAEEGVWLAGAPSSSEPSAGPSMPDVEDSAPLLNGAPGAEPSRPGRPAGDVAVKKVCRGPPSAGLERERRGLKVQAENGSPTDPAPAWEQPSVDSLIDELLARAPSEPNGSSLSIESFSRELRELEAELQSGAGQPPASPTGPLSQEEETYERFALPPDRPAPAASGGAPGPLAQLVSSPLRTPGQPPSQPFTGPFVAVLLAKLENMVQNSLYVNVLVTGLVARLACYPQPLLRSFLLNTNMVFQPSVKSLLQVLGSVKNKIESFAARQEDFPALLFKARKYLLARGQLDWADAPNAVPALRRSETLVKSRKPSIGELLLRHANSPTRVRQAAQLALQQAREVPAGTEKPSEALRVRNAVYSAVIFSEFLKELAAIAQVHAVTSPFLLEPEE
ncbi:FHF complex subunit HOOK interacting protein 1B [Dermochelys coriacea]|uniref:FHF complex subunit HOOK interacting protein 1B n=1 Tax=Dermochelys coriacea TaxID=27794 RepID=UPI001CAA3EEB|nr:FHF complex subunit HOOK interacting protein 1B [Dermochelys coriacea]